MRGLSGKSESLADSPSEQHISRCSRESRSFSLRKQKLDVVDQYLRAPPSRLKEKPGEIPWGVGVEHEVFRSDI